MKAGRRRRVALPGVEISLLEAGQASGDPVVLLHGWPQHGHMWRHLIGELAPDYRLLVPDLRGFGRSQAPRGDYRKHVFCDDLVALLDAEGIERAAIVGHDWGGWTAWLAALEHPDRVTRFVSIDIAPPARARPSLTRLPQQLVFSSYQVLISTPWLGERLVRSGRIVRAVLRRGAHGFEWSDAELAAYTEPLRDLTHARASVSLYRTFLTRELPAISRGTYTADELRIPGLVIMGSESAILKMTGAPEPTSHLEVEIVDGAGHFIPEEKPAEVATLVRGFLERQA
jgi:pimeloyl-ACP methyl ester carboxylesterase